MPLGVPGIVSLKAHDPTDDHERALAMVRDLVVEARTGVFVPNSQTLALNLCATQSVSKGRELSRSLWSDVLNRWFADSEETTPEIEAVARLSASFAHAAEVQAHFLADAAKHVYKTPIYQKEIAWLASRVSDEEGRVWPFAAEKERWTYAHGDFHARNVLWMKQTPYIIDWARASLAPRWTDVSCLAVDLTVRLPQMSLSEVWSVRRIEADARRFLTGITTSA